MEISATPSTSTCAKGGFSSSTHSDTRGSRRKFLPLTVFDPVLKTRLPSSSAMNQIGATWGLPSALTVASLPVRVPALRKSLVSRSSISSISQALEQVGFFHSGRVAADEPLGAEGQL